MSYANIASGYVRIPALGEYDLSPRAIKVGECIIASGDTAGTPAATSDTDANWYSDTQEILVAFGIEGSSDVADQGIWVTEVRSLVITPFTASVNINVGDTDDTDGWGNEAAIGATATGQLLLTGSDDADYDNMAIMAAFGKHYATSSGVIDVGISGADPAAGRLAVYASYFYCDRAGSN